MVITKNYKQWKCLHYSWDSVDHFIENFSWRPGVHSVRFQDMNLEVDIMLSELRPDSSLVRLPVLFSGAISKRGTKSGPFFSGLKIARTFEFPMISIADPLLDSKPELSLGWYTGGTEDRLVEALSNLLGSISACLKVELLLAGGSGGGYAALNLSRELADRASVFVWNPQTDIYNYGERHVKEYLRQVFSFAHSTLARSDWKTYCRPRTDRIFATDVLVRDLLKAPKKLLYLQNRTDWHFETHLRPLWKLSSSADLITGLNAIDEDHVIAVHDFASGHDPLDPDLIGSVIKELAYGEKSLGDVFNQEWLLERERQYRPIAEGIQ